MKILRPILANCCIVFFWLVAFSGAQTQAPVARESTTGPDAAMMAPVTELATYMAHLQGAVLPNVFVEGGPVIVEDFAPYLFNGKDAAAQWDAGFRQHAVPLRDLQFSFGAAHAFERTGDRAYFVLPTTWRGIYKDRRFEEHGAWSFVLKNSAGQWRILAYGWGPTDLTDKPAKSQ
ncbi:MAG TPA: hypothetical protein VKP61_07390 [Candidatus Acidoferrum sp.]|nr:hypothetical protein [Candidatus Acidoferrum sp.]